MGFFDTGYQPTEKDRWQMKQREERDRTTRAAADEREANRIRQQMMRDEVKADADRQKMAQSILSQAQKDAAAQEKAILTQPIIRRVGGTDDTGSVLVWHWRCEPPTGVVLKQQRKGSGFILRLPRGGGVSGADTVLAFVDSRRPQWIDENPEWVSTCTAAITEVKQRYLSLLKQLRDDREMGRLFYTAGVTIDTAKDEPMQGTYGVYTRKVTERSVPSLTEVMIGVEGLELVYAHRPGDSAKRWSGKIDTLRSAFAARGVDSSRLRVVDGADGSIRLIFDDAPTVFPEGVAFLPAEPPATVDEAKARYPKATWCVGVDARGNKITPTVKSTRHCIAAGQSGAGKSVWVRSVIEWFRVGLGAEIYLGDGKGSDYAALAGHPNVRMVSTSPEQHLRMVTEVCDELERRRAEAAINKRTDPNPYDRYSPILLALDEFGTMKDEINDLDKKEALELFMSKLARIIKVGREARIVILLAAQDVYADTIPVALQNQFGLAVLLGVPGERTISGDFVPEKMRDRARRIGARLTRPGAALYIERETERVIEVQTPYSYSPGSTPLSAALTDEQRQIWSESEQRAASLPWFYPRLGIKAEPGWEKGGAEAIIDTELVAITDREGDLLPGMERFDPISDDWTGAAGVGTVKPRPGGWDQPTAAPSRPTVVEPTAASITEPDSTPEPAGDDDALLEALAEAQRRGLIPTPDQDEQSPQRGGGAF